jgi:hypothetical protein
MRTGVCPESGSHIRTISIAFLFIFIVSWPARCRAQASYSIEPKPGVGHTIRVSFQYEHPDLGAFELYYELGRSFDPAKRTVFVVGDGQQYYVRKGLIEPLQEEIFGDRFNVVGLIGRGANEVAVQHVKHGESIDWLEAYGVFKSSEWVEDIESVRKDLLGASGKVCFYGRSGGATLVHQFLAKHADHVLAVFTQASYNPFLDVEFGLSSDTFWDEIAHSDAALQLMLLEALSRHSSDRSRIVLLLQRQNFFVPANQIAAERAKLIHALHDWDQAVIDKLSEDYQVNAILETLAAPDPAANVREFELYAPIFAQRHGQMRERIDPDFEVSELFSQPLLGMLENKQIAMPTMDFHSAHRMEADVFLLAGRFDHDVDYRSQFALASAYPNHRLLLLSDDHTFMALKKTGLYPRLVQTALAEGVYGPAKAGVENQLGALVYREF